MRFALFIGLIYAGYTLVADKIIEKKLPEWQKKTEELVNPKGARADLLENLEIRLSEIKTNYAKIKNVDLDSITDPEVREIVKGIQENLTEKELEEVVKLVEDIRKLNNNESITNSTIGKILDKILPDSTPAPAQSTSTPNPTLIITPAPSTTPPAQQCSWLCQ